ncbi:5-(carboxyamino)imidazole ribonucleotide synthase [Kineosporia babensis]|uniref:N5-carboxyaminoimidazole ribonucleotide synthase n=1 Tax=Kineosporia babensis TaxID=499548 RepID=A0A9X1NGZ6_9ACTN|nr:5-(carboxyamino)imidazole ribonucleotide synthase [Kineosporia babensis]
MVSTSPDASGAVPAADGAAAPFGAVRLTPLTAADPIPGGFPTVGVIGGGQLARMMQPPAVALGVRLRVLAESETGSAALAIHEAPVGDHRDLATVTQFASQCDVLTFEHEHVPGPILEKLIADGVPVRPGPAALGFAQDKLAMRTKLTELGLPCPSWAQVRTWEELQAFAETVPGVVLKTPRGGYDGKGVLVLSESTADTARNWLDRAGPDGLLAEEKVAFTRELAALIARSPSGQAAAWPVVESTQKDGICHEVIAPAPNLTPEQAAEATSVGLRIAGELGVVGVLAVELFQTEDGRILVNELAMRPHNSGHWTIDGAVTSQFEQHLRAVLDLPLGEVRARAPWTVMVNVLGGEYEDLYRSYLHVMAHDPGVKVHMYAKEVRLGRKIGHVTVCGDDLDDCLERARHAAAFIRGDIDE